jgi:hypothetical protein
MPEVKSSNSGALSNQPSNQNFLSPIGFRFGIRKLPLVNWFLQSVSIPGITMNEAIQPTPFIDAYQPGEKLTYDPLTITFKVDEDMKNWSELQEWLVGIGNPRSFQEYKANLDKHGGEAIVSDGTLMIMNSNMNANFEIIFHDMFPTTISELALATTDSDITYVTATATFRYLNYEFRKLNG